MICNLGDPMSLRHPVTPMFRTDANPLWEVMMGSDYRKWLLHVIIGSKAELDELHVGVWEVIMGSDDGKWLLEVIIGSEPVLDELLFGVWGGSG